VGNTFYVITEGKCRVTVATEDGREKEMRTFFPGDYFGETALISSDSIRTANVISTGYVQCLCLSRVDFSTLLSSAASAIMEQSLSRQKETAEAANNTGVNKRERRRISAFGEDGSKHAGMAGILFHRIGKFMTQSLFLSMYWRMYRAMVLHPHKKELYGPLAAGIMEAHADSAEARFLTCDAIRTEALRILHILPSHRNGDEHAFVIGLFAQPNQLRKNLCPDWPENKWQMLCRHIRYKHSVDALRKVNDVGDTGTSAMLIMQGAVRLHANYHDDVTDRSSLVYEEDINAGELFHIAALGGMHRRLLAATAITNIDLAEIEYDDFLDAKGNDVYTLSTDEKYRFLENVPLFKGWEPYALYLMAQQLQHEDSRIGTKLLSTAKYTDKIYFLLHGKINILSNVNRTSTMATMQRYDYFGESSVLNHFFADPANVAGHFQTKKERRILRNGKNKRHPKVYYELTDAVTGSNAEFLVLHKKDFNLFAASSVEAMRTAYYKRAVGRLQRSKLLYQEEKTAKGFCQNFVAVAKLAMEEDNPDAYYNTNVPNDHEEKMRNAGKLNYPPIKDTADRMPMVEEGSLAVSHGSMHGSAVQISPHLTGRADGFVQPNHLEQLVHEDDLKGSFRPLTANGTFKETLPELPGSPLPARPNTSVGLISGGRGSTAQNSLGRFPKEVRHVEDIPGVLNGVWNPVGLLGTCKTDKERNKVQKMLKETYKVRSASEMHSKLGEKEKAHKAKLTRSLSDKVISSRPNTAGHISIDGESLMDVKKDTHRLSEFLRGSHQMHAGKHYHETLHPSELIKFRPSTSRTMSKVHR
jgi:CRP-like cAMP-binding protein